jgi:hypothetical protein
MSDEQIQTDVQTKVHSGGAMRTVLMVVAATAVIGAAFWGGTLYGRSSVSSVGDSSVGAGATAQGRIGGPMNNLSEEERAALEDMTDEERQAWMQEQFGDSVPGGVMPGGRGGGTIEGTVVEVASDAMTLALADDSSQVVYTDDETIVAYVQGVTEITAGSGVTVIAVPEADNVVTAALVVVTE